MTSTIKARWADMPDLTTVELRRVGLELPGLEGATVEIGSAGTGRKRHALAEGFLGTCQFPSRRGESATLITVVGDVCLRCRPYLVVPNEVVSAWDVARRIVGSYRKLAELDEGESRDWLGYARALAAAPYQQDRLIRTRLRDLADAGVMDVDRGRLADAWERLFDDWRAFLEEYRRSAPNIGLAARVSAACDQVGRNRDVHRQGELLMQIVRTHGYWNRDADLSEVALEAWKTARTHGADAEEARERTREAVAERLAGKPVCDISLLPKPSATDYQGEEWIGDWAEREFAHLRDELVTGWIEQVEDAYASGTGTGETTGDGEQLILVENWPLTRSRDADLAHLAQYDQCGPMAPSGQRRTGAQYGAYWEPAWSVVLRVPRFVAQHAAEIVAGRPDQQIILGPSLRDGESPEADQVTALLRLGYPYLEADVDADGEDCPTSDPVRHARTKLKRETRVVPRGDRTLQHYEQVSLWLDGKKYWVPGTATASKFLASALKEGHGYNPLVEVCVETGQRPDTALHTLTGELVAYDSVAEVIRLTPVGGHEELAIPLRRVVFVTGTRYDRDDLREDYDRGWRGYESVAPTP